MNHKLTTTLNRARSIGVALLAIINSAGATTILEAHFSGTTLTARAVDLPPGPCVVYVEGNPVAANINRLTGTLTTNLPFGLAPGQYAFEIKQTTRVNGIEREVASGVFTVLAVGPETPEWVSEPVLQAGKTRE